MKSIFLACFWGMSLCLFAQDTIPPPPIVGEAKRDTERVYTIVESEPSYSQGEKALFKWLSANLRYPTLARENGTEGTVYLSFVVQEDGSIADITVKRGLKDGCTEEAIRLLKAMPNWNPRRRDRRVKWNHTIPIKFKLE